MVLRNSLEKRSALERDIKNLSDTNAQLEQDLATASETLDPLTARREELMRCTRSTAVHTGKANSIACLSH